MENIKLYLQAPQSFRSFRNNIKIRQNFGYNKYISILPILLCFFYSQWQRNGWNEPLLSIGIILHPLNSPLDWGNNGGRGVSLPVSHVPHSSHSAVLALVRGGCVVVVLLCAPSGISLYFISVFISVLVSIYFHSGSFQLQ